MTTPISDATLAIVKAEAECGFIAGIEGETVLRVIERLAKAEALAKLEEVIAVLRGVPDAYAEAQRNGEETGQRRATAAIVADLRGADPWHGVDPHTANFLATRYERGDHITEAKP
jgi:hypothetical protein